MFFRIMKSLIKNHYRAVLNVFCALAFIFQLYEIVNEWTCPTQTTTAISTENLQDSAFPIIFQICVHPGFNRTAVTEEGYDRMDTYFRGQSRYNKSVYGWAGHSNETFQKKTVEGKKII